MEAAYARQPLPPSSQPTYTMPPGPPSSLPPNEADYHRDVHPPYHAAPVSQHQQNGQQYAYSSNTLPSLANRTPLPDQLLVSENGSAALPLGQILDTPQEPPSHSMIELGRHYRLEVVQQPKRARMCGFGDKDRRPITPPPCIRLVITDAITATEIDTNDIDFGLFVLNVDLWSADGTKEVNLVRHSSPSPSISSTIPTSYGQSQGLTGPIYNNPLPIPTGHPSIVRDPQYPYHLNQPTTSTPAPGSQGQSSYPAYSQQQPTNHYSPPPNHQTQTAGHPQSHYGPPPYHQPGSGYPPNRPSSPPGYQSSRYPDPPNHHVYYHTGSSVHDVGGTAPPRSEDPQGYNPVDPRMSVAAPIPAATGMFTRNLIGSLSASAFRLTDNNDKMGIWFVLQDLSVRTEGSFRLRFSFVNVGAPSKTPNGNPANQISIVNTGKAPILASCYSEVFTVFSAKKFPGVVESTQLSRCFAHQGIKIPIRKDGPSKAANRDDYDED